jgi:hypothetical protein
MTDQDLTHVQETVNEEGFDYTFLFHDEFAEIDDPMFHILRQKYIDASQALYEYLKMDAAEFATTEPTIPSRPTLKSW